MDFIILTPYLLPKECQTTTEWKSGIGYKILRRFYDEQHARNLMKAKIEGDGNFTTSLAIIKMEVD